MACPRWTTGSIIILHTLMLKWWVSSSNENRCWGLLMGAQVFALSARAWFHAACWNLYCSLTYMVECLKVRLTEQRRKSRKKIKDKHDVNKNVNKAGNVRNFYLISSCCQDAVYHTFSAWKHQIMADVMSHKIFSGKMHAWQVTH